MALNQIIFYNEKCSKLLSIDTKIEYNKEIIEGISKKIKLNDKINNLKDLCTKQQLMVRKILTDKLKISNSNKNKIRSEELKLRWSNIKKENPNPELYKLIVEKAKEVNSIRVLKYNKNMEFIKEYSSMSEAARDINGDPSTISKVCKGKIKSHRNFIFKIKY